MWWSFSVLCFLRLQNSLHTGVSWWVIIRPCSLPTGPKVTFILPHWPPASRASPSATLPGSLRSLLLEAWAYRNLPQRNPAQRRFRPHRWPQQPPSPMASTCQPLGASFTSKKTMKHDLQDSSSPTEGKPSSLEGVESPVSIQAESHIKKLLAEMSHQPGRCRAAKSWPPFCSPRDPNLLLGWQSLRPEVEIMK